MGKKIIEFALKDEISLIAKLPSPAIEYLPKWYKDSPLNTTKNPRKSDQDYTIKACVPFLDSFRSGYIFELWTDLEVIKTKEDGRNFVWGQKEYPLIKTRSEEFHGQMPSLPNNFGPQITLSHPLYIKTPPGYSVLITNPFNQFDKPLTFLSGIIDTDIHPLFPGNMPFMLDKDFEGVIPIGTPLIQIIPFKRDEWISKENKNLIIEGNRAAKFSQAKFFGWYRYNAFSKKIFK
jgi:hypothetical protein